MVVELDRSGREVNQSGDRAESDARWQAKIA